MSKKHTLESKQKISAALKGRKHSPEAIERMRAAKLGKKMSDEARAKISAAQRGKKMSAEFCEKLRQRMIGNSIGKGVKRAFTDEHKAKISASCQGRKGRSGSHNPKWAGDGVGYTGLHLWVRRQLGTPSKCEFCETESAAVYDWANKSGQYKREVSDWIRLCRSCHMKYDKNGFKATRFLEFNGERRTLKQWSELLGIKYTTLYNRIYTYGMPVGKALTMPAKMGNNQFKERVDDRPQQFLG